MLLTCLWLECDFIHSIAPRAGFVWCSSLWGSHLCNVQPAAGHKPCSSAADVAQLDLLSPEGLWLQHLGRSCCCFPGQEKNAPGMQNVGGRKFPIKNMGSTTDFGVSCKVQLVAPPVQLKEELSQHLTVKE